LVTILCSNLLQSYDNKVKGEKWESEKCQFGCKILHSSGIFLNQGAIFVAEHSSFIIYSSYLCVKY